jgi:hypothetical protein
MPRASAAEARDSGRNCNSDRKSAEALRSCLESFSYMNATVAGVNFGQLSGLYGRHRQSRYTIKVQFWP